MVFPMDVPVGSITVKIYKGRNGVYRETNKNGEVTIQPRFSYLVSYFADGKRIQKMFADFDEAHAHAKEKADNLNKGQLKALPFSDAEARIYTYMVALAKETGMPPELLLKDAVEAWKALGGKASLLEAAKEFARRHMHELPKMNLPKAVEEMINARTKDGTSPTYIKVLKVYLNPLKKSFNCPLKTITSGQIGDYLRDLDVGARSKNNARSTIGAFFKFCKERGWIPRDHEGIELVPKFKEQATDITIYTPWEVTQFLNHARPEILPFLAIGAFAGLRSAEIERLDWSEVHLDDKFIEIKAQKAKTAARRIVPISDNLAAWLKDYVKKSGPVEPFDNVNKQLSWLEDEVDEALAMDALKAAAAKTGREDWKPEVLLEYHRKCSKAARSEDALKEGKVKRTHAKPEQPKARPGITFLPDKTPVKYQPCPWKKNALRHSYISYRVAEVQDVPKVALEAGNSAQIIFQHYRELVQAKDAKAWFGIFPIKTET